MWMSPARRILPNDVELSNSIRRRWMDLARWLRDLIYSEIWGLGNREAMKMRLTQLADEAGAFFTQYYGEETGTAVATTYKDYFSHVTGMIESYKQNNTELIAQQRYSMYKDADDLAQLYSQVNRYWDEATMRALLYVLVDNTEKQIENIFAGNYAQEVISYDQYVEQTYRIADEITYGILQQFRLSP